MYKKNILPSKIKSLNYILKKKYEELTISIFNSYLEKNGKPDLCHVFDTRFGLVAGSIIKKNSIYRLFLPNIVLRLRIILCQ